jgi:hypothetical protein
MTHQFMYPKVTPVRPSVAGATSGAAGIKAPAAASAAGAAPRNG